MKHQRLCLVLGLGLAGAALLSLMQEAEAQLGGGQTCHLRELDLCLAPMLVLTQSPSGLATTDKEIDKQCNHLRDSDTCLKNYTRRCMSPLQRELAHYAANTTVTMLNEYCTKGSQLRKDYLRHAPCMNQADRKQQKACLREFQAALELMAEDQGDDGPKKLQLACCSYRRFRTCLSSTLERKCGNESSVFVDGLVRRATSRLPDTVCRNYRPEGAECKALLPKPSAVPKGAKSASIVSRLMSAYTGL